ncbi:hypothetical protein SDC9_209273 [bioreactor metagenome]|uniref:Uncharacterized protein n=1 Tax=bioreactor metagenome TaxID=1076179 RepID=A0A645JCT5_9ZZZZ
MAKVLVRFQQEVLLWAMYLKLQRNYIINNRGETNEFI